MLSRCFLDFSVGVGAFVIGLSQISSFFSSHFCFLNHQPLLVPKQNMCCTRLYFTSIYLDHKSVTIMCFINTWTRVSLHSVILN